jgi:hypothetical protein
MKAKSKERRSLSVLFKGGSYTSAFHNFFFDTVIGGNELWHQGDDLF